MSYNGYANQDSYYFDVVWANDRPLYEAIKSEAKRLLDKQPGMTDQTLGLNILHALKAAVNLGGWGYSGVPEGFKSVPRKSYEDLITSCRLAYVNETEFGGKVRDALGVDDG